ncbi:MAG: hypothetical protein LC689_20210 [Myxococcales bacterium]|nr:hypothetical protein [Myxococcales bacterium]
MARVVSSWRAIRTEEIASVTTKTVAAALNARFLATKRRMSSSERYS